MGTKKGKKRFNKDRAMKRRAGRRQLLDAGSNLKYPKDFRDIARKDAKRYTKLGSAAWRRRKY